MITHWRNVLQRLLLVAINFISFFNQLVVNLLEIEHCIKLHLLAFYVCSSSRWDHKFSIWVDKPDVDASAEAETHR